MTSSRWLLVMALSRAHGRRFHGDETTASVWADDDDPPPRPRERATDGDYVLAVEPWVWP